MRFIRIAALILAVGRLPAAADTLPFQFRGHWCGAADDDGGMHRVSRSCEPLEDRDTVIVNAKGVIYLSEDGPSACKVIPYGRPKLRDVYIARLACDHAGADGIYRFELLKNNRLLITREKRE